MVKIILQNDEHEWTQWLHTHSCTVQTAQQVIGCSYVNSGGRARDVWLQGDRSSVPLVVECVSRCAGTGEARGQARSDSRGQEHDLQVARQTAVRETSYGGRDSAGAGGDAGIVARSRAGHRPMQTSRVAGCAWRLYSSRSVFHCHGCNNTIFVYWKIDKPQF